MTSIKQFLNDHSIAWFPVHIEVGADGKKRPAKHPDELPPWEWTHFKAFQGGEDKLKLLKRVQHDPKYNSFNAIAIDTRSIYQIDIDEMNSEAQLLIERFEDAPQFPSFSKSLPHIFFISTIKSKQNTLKTGCGELLTGQFSYCRADAVVKNPGASLPCIDHSSLVASRTEQIVPSTEQVLSPELLENTQRIIQKCVPNHSKTQVKKILKSGAITTNGKYCFNINRNHRSNNVFFKIRENKVFQRCCDPDCADYESQGFDIPEEFVEPPSDMFDNYFRILNPPMFVRKTDHGFQMLDRSGLIHHFLDKGGKKAVDAWLSSSHPTFERMDYIPPPLVCPDNVYNTWDGFPVEKFETGGNCDPWLEHLRLMFPEKSVYDYIIKWLARIFQEPGNKTCVGIIIFGDQGIGKGILAEQILSRMMGESYMMVNDIKNQMMERFAEAKNRKILVNPNDCPIKTFKSYMEEMKNYITAERLPYEAKGQKPIDNHNCVNLINTFNGNHLDYKFDADDRRWVIIKSVKTSEMTPDHFGRIGEWLRDDRNIRAFYDHLMAQDIRGFDFQKERPITQYYREAKELSAMREHLFLKDLLDRAKTEFTLGDYTEWFANQGFEEYERPANTIKLGFIFKSVPSCERIRTNTGAKYKIDKKLVLDFLRSKGIGCLLI
jgi:hypothetical protein